ncbi:hypothetical protein RRG08_043006 [Elysia crispata]|uniref:Uncharacterized protein n=1 Tax=Elysia crispata TaxID=231223 RepID=A0AAE1CPE7_9GAST|nr:hypothetical protein RRG08_043006 [Elysia crispata]
MYTGLDLAFVNLPFPFALPEADAVVLELGLDPVFEDDSYAAAPTFLFFSKVLSESDTELELSLDFDLDRPFLKP